MLKSSKARLFSTCLTGAVLAAATPAWSQTSEAPTWKPRAEAEAQAGKDIGVSTSLFAPVAQSDSGLVYVDGRIGYDQRFDRNGSATLGARFRVGDDVAIGANVGADFYRSDIGSRDQAAVSMGLEGFTSVFDIRVNYRLPISKTRTIGYIDPAASATGALVLENNRLIERRSGFRLEAIPLQGFNGEAGVRLPVGGNASIRASAGGFDYWDKDADKNYRGVRGGLELDIEDQDSGTRFTFGGTVEHDNRYGTDARATVRLSIPFGGRASDRGSAPTGLDRQMGDRVRRDYVARSGSRYTDLTSERFAVDARTGNPFGSFYYASGTGAAGAAGTLAAPTTLADAVTRAGANGVVVALGSGGTITTPGVTLAANQYLLGGASAVDVRLLNGNTAQYALGGTNGTIVGTSAAAATVALGQGSVVRDLTVRGVGVGISANGVGGFAIERVIVENTGGAGLSLTNTLGAVSLTGLTVRGGAGAGVLVNGGASVSLANSTISGGAGAVDINDAGGNLTLSLSNLTLSATGGNVLDIDGSGPGTVTVTGMSGITIRGGTGETGGVSVRSATFDANTTTAGIQTVNAGRMGIGTAGARVNGQGAFFTDVTGSLSFADLDVANSGATGLRVVNSKVNSFTLATLDGTIDTVGGTAADLDPLVIDLNFASVSSAGAPGPGLILSAVQGGGTGGNALTIGTLTISNSGGEGLVILNSTGLVRVNGGAIANSGGSSVRIGQQGVAGSGGSASLAFGASITDAAGASPIVAVFSAAGTISFTGPISGSGGIQLQDTLAGSTVSFGAMTLTGTAGDAITLNNLAGAINFTGLVTIANPGARGIVVGNVQGGVSFADVDITGLGNFAGLDVRGAHGTVLFNTLDITGTGGGTGIDVTGSTNAGNVMILRGSVIEGVNIGVNLTQASMTGQFRYGDGDATVLNSRITANTPIVIVQMNGSAGAYNFADVALQGDTTNLTGGAVDAYYAKLGATGAGTRSDPGSLAGADASSAQYIVLLNDPAGGQDIFDAASAGGSFDLAAGQNLVSFLTRDFIAVPSAALPANLIVSGLGPTGITNPYAGSGGAVLTTTAGAATVNLANNSSIDGLTIRNAGGNVGVEGSGVGNVRISNANISGATGAIAISDGGATSSVQLTHLDLASAAGTTLSLSGAGAGTLTVSGADIDIDATGTSAALALADIISGGLGFGTISTGTSATTAVSAQNVTGANLVFGSIAVGGTAASAGVSIDGNASAVVVQSISVSGSAGDAVQLSNNSGTVAVGAISASASGGDAVHLGGNIGAVTIASIVASGSGGDAVDLTGNRAVAIGGLTASGSGGAGLNIQNSLGTVSVDTGTINGAATGVSINGVATGTSVSIGDVGIGGISGTAITLADADGSVTFTGTTNISGVGVSAIAIGAGSSGAIRFGDVDILGLGAGRTGVDARNASGTVTFNTLDISGSSTAGTRGIDLTGATFATNFITTESSRITGVGIGVDLTNAAITGNFRYGDGSNTDADGAASGISAVTPIVITGVAVGTGSYNFLDVALTGDTSTLTTSSTLYFVKAGANGAGTMADPGSLAGAEASAADTIILLNDPAGGQDVLDAAGAGGAFDLAAGRSLLGFLNGDTLMLPGGAPANILFYGVPQGQVANPFAGSGAPILTTTVGATSTVTLGGSNLLDGLVIRNGGNGTGVWGVGVSNLTIRNSWISGPGGAITLADGGVNMNVALRNLHLGAGSNSVVVLDGTGGGTLTVTALDQITVEGGNGESGGLIANQIVFDADIAAAGAQAVTGSLTIGAPGARVGGIGLGLNGASGSLDLTSLDVVNINGVGLVLNGSGSLTAIIRAGSIDTVGDEALVAQNAALTLDFGSIIAIGGGVTMIGTSAADPAKAVLKVDGLDLSDGGLFLDGSGDYVFANASIDYSAGAGVFLFGAANLDYAGNITAGPGAGAAVATLSHSGTASFHDGTIDVTGGNGFQFIDADGTYSFTGTATLHGGDAGINIASGSSGSFFFNANTSVTDGAVANFMLQNSDANVTYLGSLSQNLNTDNLVVVGQLGGVLDFSDATVSASAGTGLLFIQAGGSTSLGNVTLSGGAGIAVTVNSTGSISFGNVDITGVGANQTAVDLTGALGNVTFQTLDITGASAAGSTGIDLSGSTTAANIVINESSAISGVGTGVDLTNAAITGSFRYGDGSNTDADGAASTIDASVPILIGGLNAGVGSYDFADVNLIGDTSTLVTSATTYFVAAGATGAGTMADPGSLSGAEASNAQIIVLLNDPAGGQDMLDALDAGGSFDLDAGQSLLGFLNGDTLTLPGGGPANLILFGITPGQLANRFAGSGAPLLTNSGAGNTLSLGTNTLVDGVIVGASNGPGILASGAANVTIRNSIVSGSQGAIVLADNGFNASAALRNLQLSSSGGAVLNLAGGGGGTLTLTALDGITIAGGNGETSGILGNGVVFDADLATAGYQAITGTLQIGTMAARIGGIGVYLDQTVGATDFTLGIASDGGSGLYAAGGIGGLRLGIGGTIDTINGGVLDYGLILQDLSASVTLASLGYSGAGLGVWTNNVAGVGAGGSALDIASLNVADGSGGAIAMTGSATGSFSFGAGSTIGTTTGVAAIGIANTGASVFNYAGAVTYGGAGAVLGVSGGHAGIVNYTGSIDASSGTGLVFDNADGTYNFTGTSTLAAGIRIFNGADGTFGFGADTAIVSPAANGIDIEDSTASVDYAGTLTYAGVGFAAINIVNHSGGTLGFGGVTDISTGSGIRFDNADGTYVFSGTTTLDAGNAGIVIANGSGGSFSFGAGTTVINSAGGSALAVSDSTASIDYSGYAYAFGGNGLSIVNHSLGTIDFSAATLDLNGGTTLRFDNADGSYSLGSFATTGGSGIAIVNGSAGSFTFGDVDVADLGAGQTAVDLTGATGGVTFQTLDITGSGGTGIDLSGSTTAADIVINESSSIVGVGIGVDLTSAAITGHFRYGDGSSTDADGAASTINAVTPIAIGGLNGAIGTYNFADVVLTGDTSGLQTNKTIFWVQAGATGAGTRSDPGSLAGAEASGVDIIILLDTQTAGQDVIDGASAGGGLDLIANQSLLSFLNGDTLSVGGGAPANMVLFGISGGSVTNPYAGSGAPLLTTTQAGANTVNLGSGGLIDGVEIGNLDAKGVYGGYLAAVTIRNSIIHGGANAIDVVSNGGSAALSNLDLSSTSGDVLVLRGDGGDLTVTQLANLTIRGGNSGGGLYGQRLAFDADIATAGVQTVTGTLDIGTSASRVGGAGLVLDGASGALSLATNVYNSDGDGIYAAGTGGFTLSITGGTVDSGPVATTGSALNLSNLSADVQLGLVRYSGPDFGVRASNVTGAGPGGRALGVTQLTVAGAASGISLLGTTNGNFTFGSASSISGTTVSGIALANTGSGTFTYDGSITATAGALVSVSNGDVGAATFTGTLSATGGTGLQFDNADGSYNFSGTTTLNGGDAGIDVTNGSGGSFNFGLGTSITSPSGIGVNISDSTAFFVYNGNLTYATAGQAAIRLLNHSGSSVTFSSGTISISNGTGIRFDNADGVYVFGGSVVLNGGDAGIDVVNGSAGSIGLNASITSPSGIGVDFRDSSAALMLGGTLTFATAGQAAVNVVNSSGALTFTGTLNITNGTGLQFDNADGSYSFGGTTILNGGDAGIDVVNGSAGTFTFGTGASITSPSGVAINVEDSIASVTYRGNLTYATAGNAALNVSNHTFGTISFQTGTLNITDGTGLQFSNADGLYLFGGTTTLHGGDAGIDIANNSAGAFNFGSATSVSSPSGTGIRIADSTAGVIYGGGLTYATPGGAAIAVANHSGGALDLRSATLAITGGTGLSFDNADGIYQFDALALSGGARIGVLNGSSGAFTFGDVDITGLPITQTAVNLTGATGNVTFATLDITGASASGTKGIDLTGNTGTGNIVVTNSSTITGVGIGVDLTNASRTGLFQYGDGSAPTASTISATTPIVVTGLNAGTGTYNFADVNLVGDTSGLATSATVYYVLAGASGIGTLSDPGSLAGAEAATADYIILLNNPAGGQDVLDALASNGNDSLVLDASQALRSFRDSNTIALPGGAPANIILTGVMTGQVVNPYAASAPTATDRAPILTTTGAAAALILANNGLVDGVFVQGVSGQSAVQGSGVSGVTLANSTISGAGIALRLTDGAAAASATLTNLTLSASGSNAALALSGAGAGTLTVSGSGNNVSQAGSGPSLTISDVLIGGGNLGFGAVTSTGTGGSVDLGIIGGLGTLSFGSITVAGSPGTGIALHNSSATVNLGNVTVTGAGTTALALTSNSGATTIGTVTISGSATGVSASGLSGTLTVGNGTIAGASVAGILIGAGNTVSLSFGDIDITGLQTGARGVDARLTAGSNVLFQTLDISGASATGTRGIDLTGNTGTGNFTVNESSTITGVGIGVDLTNASRTGGFRYGDGSNIDADLAASMISATTPIVIGGLNGAAGTYDFRDVTLVGDTSPLEVSAFFVRAGASGVGSRSDPGSLAAADASTASYIVLLDTQAGAGSFDTITGTLTLANNQSLLSFRDTDTFNVGGGAPPNVFVFGITTGTITNPTSGSGAPLLTSADATGTVQLGGTSVIDGVVISNTGTGAGVFANGSAGTATLRNSTISGGGAGVDIRSGAFARIVNLQNLTLANAGNQAGALLNLDGAGGTLTLTGMSNLSINTAGGETAGLVFNTVTFDSDLATAGIQAVNAGALTLGTTGARVQGDGLSLTNVFGALTFSDLDIANNGGTGLLVVNSKANSFLLTTLDGSIDTTGGTAVNLDPLTAAITLSSVTATAGAYGILLDQLEGFFTVTGAVNVTGATTAGIAIQDNTAQIDALDATFNGAVSINNTSGIGLSFTNNAGATISFAGGGAGVDIVTTSGAGLVASNGGTISFAGAGNTIHTTTGQVANFNGVTAGASGINFASLGSSGIVANTAILINNLDGGAFSGGTVSIASTSGATSDGIWIGGGSSSAISFGATTIGSASDEGIEINGAGNGAINFASVLIDGTASHGILITGSDGTVTVSAGSIGNLNDPAGDGVNIDGGSGAITIDAGIFKNTAGHPVQVTNRTGGSIGLGGFIQSGGAASGLSILNNSGGTITFSGAGNVINGGGAPGLELVNNAGTTINFTGGGMAITSGTYGIAATAGGTLNITGSGNTVSANNGLRVILLDGITVGAGGINFATVSASPAIFTGIELTNVGSAGGAITLGTVNLQGVTSRGIDVTGTLSAALTITDLDIGLNAANAVAFDLNGATLAAAITANDFDVTNSAAPGTTIAADLRGTLGGQIVRLGDATVGGAAATISGVNTGVWLDGTTNAVFTYGDGESAVDGTSTISAGTAINAAAAPVVGGYNFTDVTFGASPGLGFGVGRTWFVDSNGATGGGNGSGVDGANPMTLAAAELALAATDVIVLVNNGNAISAAGSNADNTLNLLANTQVRGFGQGPLALALTVPATIQLSSSTINIADPTGNGAATLTSAAGANVITLGASGNRISGFILDGAPGGALRGIVDNGGATGTVVNFMTIRNFSAVGGFGVEITPSTNSTIDTVTFTGNTNDLFLNAAGSTISNVTATGATGTSITLDNATGTTTLTNVTIAGAGTALSFGNSGGTINATNVDLLGATTSALTVNGGSGSFNFDSASAIVQAAGGLAVNFTGNHVGGTFAFAGLINATSGAGLQFSNADGTYNFTGTTVLNGGDAGIDIYNGSTGTFGFGLGTTLTHNNAGNAFTLLSSANVTFDGAITDNDGAAVAIDQHDSGTATFNGAIASGIGNASTVISIANSNGGTITFNGQMGIASTAASVVNLSANGGSTITFNAGGSGLDITGTGGTGLLIAGGGTLNIFGSGNSIATGTGTLLSIAETTGTATAVNLAFASATNTGGASGIVIQRTGAGTLGGTVNIAGGAITATSRGVSLAGDALDFTYGGTLATSGAAARAFEATARTSGTATLSGNLTDTSLGINIANNSGGTITFSGPTISLSTGANDAVTLSNNSGTTINFAPAGGGNGLDIVTTSGAALLATGGGTVSVTGGGNTIQTGTGRIASFTGVSAGAGGINFASLQSTGLVAGIAINFNNFDGSSFAGGTTSIAATSGGNDGIFIGNGSAAAIGFGATTIGTAGNTISGDGIEINGSGNGAVTFASVDIDNTAAHGVSIVGAAGLTGAIAINGGTIGAGPATSIAGDGVNVTGGGNDIAIAAAITKTSAGNVVEVNGHTGGTVTFSGNLSASGALLNGILVTNNTSGAIAFSGAAKTLTTGANTAVSLSTNTGTTIDFTGGGLAIGTTSGVGFLALGGGTVTVQGGGNTITATTGTALRIANTAIGAADVTFRSISSNGGTDPGIVLDTTGAAGGLHVTGNGAAGTGGTIANKGGADGSSAQGIGIYLNNTADVQLDRMQLNDFQNYAIRGLSVNGFALNNSVVNASGAGKNGTSAAVDEGSISFGVRNGTNGLTGTASITNTNIEDGFEDSFSVFNTSGTLNLILDNVSISGSGNDGIVTQNFGTATVNIDVRNSDFSGNIGDHFNATADGAANLNVQFGNNGANTLVGGTAGALGEGIAIQTGVAWSGTGSAIISNNTITFAEDTPININIGGTGTFGATVSGNTIGANGAAGSGTVGNKDAIRIIANGDGSVDATPDGGTLTARVSNNLIQQVSGRGIYSLARDGGTAGDPIQLNLTIVGNTLRQSPNSGGQGIRVEAGATSADHVRLHVDIGGAGGAANVFADDWGTNLPAGIDYDEIRITNTILGSQFILTGFAGSGTDMAAVAAYLTARNSLPAGGVASATNAAGNSYTTGGPPPSP